MALVSPPDAVAAVAVLVLPGLPTGEKAIEYDKISNLFVQFIWIIFYLGQVKCKHGVTDSNTRGWKIKFEIKFGL